jgi:5'-nucleotidase
VADIIEEMLIQQCGGITEHLHVVSNHMVFDKRGHVTGFSKPVFHVFNKRADSATHSSFFKRHDLKHRENLILIGDSLGDVKMPQGLHYDEGSIIRIGFLNDKLARLPEYMHAYDVIILGDPNFEFPTELLGDILDRSGKAVKGQV